jgi:hypothetical protein
MEAQKHHNCIPLFNENTLMPNLAFLSTEFDQSISFLFLSFIIFQHSPSSHSNLVIEMWIKWSFKTKHIIFKLKEPERIFWQILKLKIVYIIIIFCKKKSYHFSFSFQFCPLNSQSLTNNKVKSLSIKSSINPKLRHFFEFVISYRNQIETNYEVQSSINIMSND